MNLIKEIDRYMERVKITRSDSTYIVYDQLANYFRSFLNVLPSSMVDDRLIMDFISWMKHNTRCCDSTINMVLNFISRCFPNSFSKSLYLHATKRHFDIISKEDQKQIFNYLEEHKNEERMYIFRLMIYLLYDTGVRQHELLHIKTSNINLKDNSILIQDTKTRDDRFVFYTDRVKSIIVDYLKRYDQKYLFMNNGELFNREDMKRIYRRLKRNLDLSRIHSHMFRHTLGTELIESGCSLFIVQKQLGHKSINTTMIYNHMSKIAHKEFMINVKR